MKLNANQSVVGRDPRIQAIAKKQDVRVEDLAAAIEHSGLNVEEFLRFYVSESVSSAKSNGASDNVRHGKTAKVSALANAITILRHQAEIVRPFVLP